MDYPHTMSASAIPAKPRGLALLLNWRRVRFTLIASIVVTLPLAVGWKSGLLSLLLRTLTLGFIAMLAFGLFEQWPRRLPNWLARWVLQVLGVAVAMPLATFVIYVKHRERAALENDECLRTIYDFVARDEIAHCRFYQSAIKVLLEEDRDGTLADMAHVFANFEMPGVGIVPDYDSRILKMREAGIDRSVFIQKVYMPILKYLGVSRHEMLAAQREAIGLRAEARALEAAKASPHQA